MQHPHVSSVAMLRPGVQVQAFYAAMGQFVGTKLEGSSGQAPAPPPGPVQKQPARQAPPSQQRRAPQILTRLPDVGVD